MKSFLRIVFVNLVILTVLITVGNLLAAAAIMAIQASKPKLFSEAHLVPNYAETPWALTHFSDYRNMNRGLYKSFYGWKFPEFHSETININADGTRNTPEVEGASTDKTIAFFGGSTA